MKTTKAKLKQLIKEELQVVLTNEEVEENEVPCICRTNGR